MSEYVKIRVKIRGILYLAMAVDDQAQAYLSDLAIIL